MPTLPLLLSACLSLAGCSDKLSQGDRIAQEDEDSGAPMPVHPHSVGVDWTPLSPTPAGEFNAISISPNDPSRVYAGSEKSGLFMSTAATPSFSRVGTTGGVSPHILQPVVEAPGELGVVVINCLHDLWLSTNGGITTRPIPWLSGINSGVMSVAALPGLFIVAEANGNLWTSSDHFTTTDFAGFVDLGGGSKDWEDDEPAVSLVPVDEDLWLISSRGGGVWRSESRGLMWDQVITSTVAHDTLSAQGDMAVVAAPDDVWTSSDAGVTWTPLPESPAGCTRLRLYDETITGVCSGDLWVSHDRGVSWSSHSFTQAVEGVAIDPSDPLHIVVGLHEAIAWSIDGGESFESTSEGLVNTDMAHLAAHPTEPDTILAGTQCTRGFFRSEDAGESWNHIGDAGHYVMGLRFSATNAERVYGCDGDSVFRSDDGGESLLTVSPMPEGIVHPHGMSVHPTDPDTLLVGTSDRTAGDGSLYVPRLLRTSDAGGSWQPIGDGLPDGELAYIAVAYHPSNPSNIWVGAGPGGLLHGGSETVPEGVGLYRSSDDGEHFERVDGIAAGAGILDISFDPRSPERVLVATDAGLHRTEDGGETWSVVTDAPGPAVVRWHPIYEETVLGGLGLETSVSIDGGVTWSPLGAHEHHARPAPLPDGAGAASSSGLSISADGETVFVGGGSAGGLRGTLSFELDHPDTGDSAR